jgi:hypothetical protein
MDRESVNRLRFDRRLEQRRGWVEDADKAAYIENLPDVTDKMTRGADEPEEADSTDAQSAPEPAAVEPGPGFVGGGQSELS